MSGLQPGADEVDMQRLACKLGFLLRLAERATYRHFLNEVEITPVQYSLLALVADNEGYPQGVLGEALNLDGATTMAIMDRLEERGWVERRRSPVDRRRYAMYLTGSGKTAIRRLEQRAEASDNAFRDRLTEREQAQLARLLGKLWSSPR